MAVLLIVSRRPCTLTKKTIAIGKEEGAPSLRQCKGPCVRNCMAKFNVLSYDLLPNPSYSPNIASSNHFLFQTLKKWLSGYKFGSNEVTIAQKKVSDLDK